MEAGDYLFTVNGNQPQLKDNIAESFGAFSPSEARRSAARCEDGGNS
jgi:hypothetical protein